MEKKSVLLVDDDVDIIEPTKILLEDEYEIYTAYDGEDAISVYEKKKPCLVFMDIKMPKRNGFEAFTQIKLLDQQAKIILVTGFAFDDKAIKAALDNGLIACLNKPLSINDMRALIKKHD